MKTGKLLTAGTNSCEEFEWDDLNYIVNDSKFKTGFFKVTVENFGWRQLSGVAYLKANKLTELLNGALPNTECSFNIHNYGKGLAIQNYHHDSNTGNEWYFAKPIAESTYIRNK